jgi:hypothetical protein
MNDSPDGNIRPTYDKKYVHIAGDTMTGALIPVDHEETGLISQVSGFCYGTSPDFPNFATAPIGTFYFQHEA